MSNTKTVIQGLDTLKNEHHQILNGLLTSVKTIKKENGDTNLMEEKTDILKKSLESIELGLSEAQVSVRCRHVIFYSVNVQTFAQGTLELLLKATGLNQNLSDMTILLTVCKVRTMLL